MKTKSVLLLAAISLLLSAHFAVKPPHTIHGIVSDETGAPIIGAAVLVKGTKNGTVTDFDGRFSLSAQDSCVALVVSYTGYETVQISKACAGKPIRVSMAPSNVSLQEVVVLGGSKASKKERSGAVQSVSSYSIAPAPKPQEGYYHNTEDYSPIAENRFHKATDTPLSTFSIDVDAASYSNMRRFLKNGQMPPADAVRIEEMINYFDYQYPQPTGDHPFEVVTEMSECPWQPEHRLLHIGLKGREIATDKLPPSNLVFLMDVSGSMNAPNKLPLLQSAFRLLVNQLRPQDKVAMVVYAGAAGLVLEPTDGNDKQKILEALQRLQAGGSTAGGAGIRLAYDVARQHFVKGGNNRVILATDGDFNVGASSDADMVRLIEEERKSGVFLTVLGFGMGNYKDNKMQQLADAGNGNHAYIDDIDEAKKVLVEEFGGTLFAIAKDVKIQIEFNPAQVAGYRLIGYENRLLNKEDFNDDKKDAGELGAGHTVTALYEIIPAGVKSELLGSVDPLKYQKDTQAKPAAGSAETATVKLRYKQPDGAKSMLLERVVAGTPVPAAKSSENFRWSAAVAEFGMLLRNSEFKGKATYQQCIQLAKQARGDDDKGYRQECVRLMETAAALGGVGEK
jgi:Ca-activated chloride channel family protein